MVKYFGDIEINSYTEFDGLDVGGIKKYEFSIDVKDVIDKKRAKAAAEKIRKLMNLTLGNDIEIVIYLYEGTDDEICIKTPMKLS